MSGRAATKNVIAGQYALSVGDASMPAPPGWRWTPLLDVARLESGHTPSRRHPEWWDGNVPWIGIKDARLHHGEVITQTLQSTNEDGLANSAARLLPAGTVCLSRTASVGYVVVMGRSMATSQDFVNWVLSDEVDAHWLKHLFIAEKDSLLRFAKGTTHSTIYYPEVKAFHVCLPPLPEQRRIVARIESIQARSRRAKEALDAIPPLLERFRQSVLAAAFRGDLTADWRRKNPDVEPASVLLERIRAERKRRWIDAEAEKARGKAEAKAQKAGKPWAEADDRKALEAGRKRAEKRYKEPEAVDRAKLPDLPTGWYWAALGDLIRPGGIFDGARDHGSKTPARLNLRTRDYTQSGVRVIRLENLGHLAFREEKRTFISREKFEGLGQEPIVEGDILIGSFIADSVRVCAVPSLPTEAITKADCFCVRPRPEVLLPRFLRLALACKQVHDLLVELAHGATRPRISTRQLRLLPVPVAPLGEQRALIEAAEGAMAGIDGLYTRVLLAGERVVAQDQSILASAFRGEL